MIICQLNVKKGTEFSIKTGECVSEGPQQIVPQEEAEQPVQCPEGTEFSIKTGECVSEGPQQIVPQEEAEQPVQCPEGTVFVPGGGCRQETVD